MKNANNSLAYGTSGTSGMDKIKSCATNAANATNATCQNFKMSISENTIQQVRDTDLINIISQYVELKKSGARYIGKCPFHNEKTPSFNVTPGKGFYCFGCDTNGANAIDFIMRYEGKDFPDAVIHVASMAGIMIYEGITPQQPTRIKIKPLQPVKPQVIDYIPYDKISLNLNNYAANNLFVFFSSLFGERIAGQVFRKYNIGSSKYYGNGTTCFIQKDIKGNIRQVKVIQYDAATGKRSKQKQFEPKIIGRDLVGYDKNLSQCFFGEPLLKDNSLPVAIVESEKTAAICSICYPKFIWIATGGKNGCNMVNQAVNKVLKGKVLHLFPDVDAIEDWRKYSNELQAQGFNVFLNDVIATNAEPGSKEDMADLVLRSGLPHRFKILNSLVKAGGNDAILNLSGKITDSEFMQRQRVIEDKLNDAGIDLIEYVMAFKNN